MNSIQVCRQLFFWQGLQAHHSFSTFQSKHISFKKYKQDWVNPWGAYQFSGKIVLTFSPPICRRSLENTFGENNTILPIKNFEI